MIAQADGNSARRADFMVKAAFLGLILAGCSGLVTACSQPAPFRVMSFNIRYAAANDGPNDWNHRREMVVETILAQAPDVFGLQEPLSTQMADLRASLPDYGSVGGGRNDGVADGEFGPIFYRQQRFTLLEHGQFWLSEHPKKAGSIGWDAALPRIATWVRLRFNDAPSYEMQVVNVHLDHVGETARLESARMIRGLAGSFGSQPVLVLGDFNCDPSSEPYRVLTEDAGKGVVLYDALASTTDSGGTYHAFTGTAQGGRIDWILINRRFECLDAAVDRRTFDGRYPSDHFPVIAMLRLK
jgi:endonuclease/exonuclease/phosphatase family metal-dependent hydrolase